MIIIGLVNLLISGDYRYNHIISVLLGCAIWLVCLLIAHQVKLFAQHQKISETLSIEFFFANPYHSWERGSNENTNGLIGQYFPKKMDFKSITEEQVKEVELKLNSCPRKRFNYEIPMFIMKNLLFNPKVAFVA